MPAPKNLEDRRDLNIAIRKAGKMSLFKKSRGAKQSQRLNDYLVRWFSSLSRDERDAIKKAWEQFQQKKQ